MLASTAVAAVRAGGATIADHRVASVAASLQGDGAARRIIGHMKCEVFVPVAVSGEAAIEADALMLLRSFALHHEHAPVDLRIVEPDMAGSRCAQGLGAGRSHKQPRKTHP
jgi:hypothetical protein